jgi:hypothetical protein
VPVHVLAVGRISSAQFPATLTPAFCTVAPPQTSSHRPLHATTFGAQSGISSSRRAVSPLHTPLARQQVKTPPRRTLLPNGRTDRSPLPANTTAKLSDRSIPSPRSTDRPRFALPSIPTSAQSNSSSSSGSIFTARARGPGSASIAVRSGPKSVSRLPAFGDRASVPLPPPPLTTKRFQPVMRSPRSRPATTATSQVAMPVGASAAIVPPSPQSMSATDQSAWVGATLAEEMPHSHGQQQQQPLEFSPQSMAFTSTDNRTSLSSSVAPSLKHSLPLALHTANFQLGTFDRHDLSSHNNSSNLELAQAALALAAAVPGPAPAGTPSGSMSGAELRRARLLARQMHQGVVVGQQHPPQPRVPSACDPASDDDGPQRSISVVSAPSPTASNASTNPSALSNNISGSGHVTLRPSSGLFRFRPSSASTQQAGLSHDPMDRTASPVPYIPKKVMPKWNDEDFLAPACPFDDDNFGPPNDTPEETHARQRPRVAFVEEPKVVDVVLPASMESENAKSADSVQSAG